jgi:type I restriction enzyme, S subunit
VKISAPQQTECGPIPSDWRVPSLGSITTLMTNGFVGKAKSHYTTSSDGVLYIQGYNVKENSFDFHGIKYVTRDFHHAHQKSNLQCGDLLTVQTGEVGLTTIVPENLVGSNCHALIISRCDRRKVSSRFVSYYMNSQPGRSRLRLIETGTTMKHLNVGDMLEFVVPLPSTLEEQEAIAEALSGADAYIVSLEQLIAKKRLIKQGVMQELLTGKRRLPGFIKQAGYINAEVGRIPADWRTANIGEISRVGRGRVISHREIGRSVNPTYPVYSSQTSNQGIMGYLDTYEFEGEYITWTTDGANAGTVFARSGRFNCTNVCGTIKLEEDNHAYVAMILGRISPRHVSRHLGNPKLMNDIVKRINIPLPSDVKEQEAIATVIKDIELEISVLEVKLEKNRQVKQGMMQELLTGRVRLI